MHSVITGELKFYTGLLHRRNKEKPTPRFKEEYTDLKCAYTVLAYPGVGGGTSMKMSDIQ